LSAPGLGRLFGLGSLFGQGHLFGLGRLFGRLLPIPKFEDSVGYLDSLVVQHLLDEGRDPLVELRVHSVVVAVPLSFWGLLSSPNVFVALAMPWHGVREVGVDFLEALKAIEVDGVKEAVDVPQRLHFDLERVVGQWDLSVHPDLPGGFQLDGFDESTLSALMPVAQHSRSRSFEKLKQLSVK
jgi:hypothetical protein